MGQVLFILSIPSLKLVAMLVFQKKINGAMEMKISLKVITKNSALSVA